MLKSHEKLNITSIFKRTAINVGVLAVAIFVVSSAVAAKSVKVGVLLPYTGTYAALGHGITEGMKLAIDEQGGKLGGHEVEYVIVDSEANPAKAPENMQKLVSGEKVDFVVGPVHSGVGMGMVKIAREEGTITIIPNAGFAAATGLLCASNIFRTSFTMWQTAFPMAKVAIDRGYGKVVTMSWKYSAGKEALESFREGFTKLGGKIVKEIYVPFPHVEFQAQLTEIAALKPDAVFVFFAGGGAAKFVKDYAAVGLQGKIPLLGIGFLTEGVLKAQGAAAEGVLTTLHYSDSLDNPVNKAFRTAYKKRTGKDADVYAVQGYDTGLMLVQAMNAVRGKITDKKALIAALEKTEINSPRGRFTFSKAHHPVQNIYLREVRGGSNRVIGVAAKSISDPGKGCRLK